MIFIILALFGVLLFWLFYSQSNTAYSQAKKHSIETLRDANLSEQSKNVAEKQLSQIIQNKPTTSLFIVAAFAIILIPLIAFRGALAVGTMACVNPCFTAS